MSAASRWQCGLSVSAVTIVVALWSLAHARTPQPIPVAQSARSIGVGAIGWLEPCQRVIRIAAPSVVDGSRIETLLVAEGDVVEAGQAMATLDARDRRQSVLAEARAQQRVAEARLVQVRAGAKPDDIAAEEARVEQLRSSWKLAETKLARAIKLQQQNAVTTEELDQRSSQLQTAAAALRQAEKSLASLTTVRPEDIAVAEAEVAKAEASVLRAEADCAACQIRAPCAGTVLRIQARPGERISEHGVLELGDVSVMHAIAEVYEADVSRVEVGQAAVVRLFSTSKQFQGEVVQIGTIVGRRSVLDNDPVKDTDARVVEVRIKLDADASRVLAGLSFARVDVNIHAAGAP